MFLPQWFAYYDPWDRVGFTIEQYGYIIYSVSVESLDENIWEMQQKQITLLENMIPQGTDWNMFHGYNNQYNKGMFCLHNVLP